MLSRSTQDFKVDRIIQGENPFMNIEIKATGNHKQGKQKYLTTRKSLGTAGLKGIRNDSKDKFISVLNSIVQMIFSSKKLADQFRNKPNHEIITKLIKQFKNSKSKTDEVSLNRITIQNPLST